MQYVRNELSIFMRETLQAEGSFVVVIMNIIEMSLLGVETIVEAYNNNRTI